MRELRYVGVTDCLGNMTAGCNCNNRMCTWPFINARTGRGHKRRRGDSGNMCMMAKGAGMSINSGGGRSAKHARCPVGDRPMDEENRPV